jgi:hypothetical protein
MMTIADPHLSDRALGWLRFLWDKATTKDDWSDRGAPHEWWDAYSSAPTCSFPRFDLAEMAYTLPIMMESTPAWREVYVRIIDELLWRYVSFWGAIDWITLVGPDPNMDRYSPEFLCTVPESLRGRYPLPSWTGNGIEPWGLQPDPVGADGNLFHRAWLNLTLDFRRYVSGEANEHQTFNVTGYRNRQFPWTHARIARLLNHQLEDKPQGPHCENTKVFPFCVTAAGLGLQLHDQLHGTTLHEPFPRWAQFAQKHFMGLKRDGELDWFCFYYDPIVEKVGTLHEPYNALIFLHLLYPQDKPWGAQLYELCTRAIGFSDSKFPIVQIAKDPRMVVSALVTAREVGDNHTEKRLREFVENEFEPRWFGSENDRFGYWFGFQEPWPRGQLNATLMMAEAGAPGAWSRVFNEPLTTVHSEPTVRGVDYPNLGIKHARNDMARRLLNVVTTAATPSQRGTRTTITVERLPRPAAITVNLDAQDHPHWRVTGTDSVEIDLDIDDHHLLLHF